nr:hypothetical protein [Tanacetum cinerariifolium]
MVDKLHIEDQQATGGPTSLGVTSEEGSHPQLSNEPKETEDALASHPPSPKTVKIQELNTQLLVLQTLNSKLIREKEAAETELLGGTSTQKNYVLTQVASVQAKIKTLDAFPSLLNKVTEAVNKFAHVIEYASKKAGDPSVPLAGLAGTHPAEGEKNTQQFIIS